MQAGLLRAPFPFQWRQGTGALIGWGVSLVAAGLVIGGITSAFTQYVAENPEVEKFVGKFGFGDLGSVAGFVGSMEVFPALAVALFAVAATNRTWEDEQERRLELALPNPVDAAEMARRIRARHVDRRPPRQRRLRGRDVARGEGGERRPGPRPRHSPGS